MGLIERFISYCKYETTSHENVDIFPSTNGQLELGMKLVKDLKEIGIEDAHIDGYGYVYGNLPGNSNGYSIGLLAHMDTSDQVSGKNVNPRIINNYDGYDIRLNDEVTMKTSVFPNLTNYIGKTLIVTDGNTLLGADDKAGIAIIMEVLSSLISHPEIEHGLIRVCFSPDEEIGRGMEHFDYEDFKVDFAYTLDGSLPNAIEYENFNACSATVEINGVSVHPGDAKGKMINALNVAHEFHSLLPSVLRPELTEGKEGFNGLMDMSGSVEHAKLSYIIRNHDKNLLEKQKADFINIEKELNSKYPKGTVNVVLEETYKNMKEMFKDNKYPIEVVQEAMKRLDMDYKEIPIRGGTDGATLSYNGILCPNLGTGGQNFHGIYEFCCVEDMEQMIKLVVVIIALCNKK